MSTESRVLRRGCRGGAVFLDRKAAQRAIKQGEQEPTATAVPGGTANAFAAQAGVRRRFAPHQLRQAHAVERAREGVPVTIIQRQLGHPDLATTSTDVPGIDPSEIVNAVHSRRPPMMPASAPLDRSAPGRRDHIAAAPAAHRRFRHSGRRSRHERIPLDERQSGHLMRPTRTAASVDRERA